MKNNIGFEQELLDFIKGNTFKSKEEIYVFIGQFMQQYGFIIDKTYKIIVSIKDADMLEITYLVQIIWYDTKINTMNINIYI